MANTNTKMIDGKLHECFSSDMGIFEWYVHELGAESINHKNIHILADGDFLRVFNDSAKKEILYEGTIDMAGIYCTDGPYLLTDDYAKKREMDHEIWQSLFSDNKLSTLIRAKDYQEMLQDKIKEEKLTKKQNMRAYIKMRNSK